MGEAKGKVKQQVVEARARYSHSEGHGTLKQEGKSLSAGLIAFMTVTFCAHLTHLTSKT